MTLGDLISGIKSKASDMFAPSQAPTPSTQNLPQLQAQYQQYAADAMTRGQQPLPFRDWVALQQQRQ